MAESAPSPEYALRPREIWDAYDMDRPESEFAGFFSTYWAEGEDIDVTGDEVTAEFVRYAITNAQQRPSAVYSGVARPTAPAHTQVIADAFEQLVDLAYEAEDTPVISYSQADISSVETVWTEGPGECIAVTEAGLAGYYDSNLTVFEHRDNALLRTSINPGSASTHMKEMFAHGFQAVVRNRLNESGGFRLADTSGEK